MHDKELITSASVLIVKVLSHLTVQCEECQHFVKASQLEEHLGSSCRSSSLAVSPTDVSVQYLLSKPSSSPLSPVEQQLGKNLVESRGVYRLFPHCLETHPRAQEGQAHSDR